jgi:hypothetical protein
MGSAAADALASPAATPALDTGEDKGRVVSDLTDALIIALFKGRPWEKQVYSITELNS